MAKWILKYADISLLDSYVEMKRSDQERAEKKQKIKKVDKQAFLIYNKKKKGGGNHETEKNYPKKVNKRIFKKGATVKSINNKNMRGGIRL